MDNRPLVARDLLLQLMQIADEPLFKSCELAPIGIEAYACDAHSQSPGNTLHPIIHLLPPAYSTKAVKADA
jgi:hypothetical protein